MSDERSPSPDIHPSSGQNYSRGIWRATLSRQADRIIPGVYRGQDLSVKRAELFQGYSGKDLSVKWAELFQGYIVYGRLDLLFRGYTAARIILPIVLMENSQRSKELRQFCPPGSSDVLCLLCINPSSMPESDYWLVQKIFVREIVLTLDITRKDNILPRHWQIYLF